MKRWNELTEDQQGRAVEKIFLQDLKLVVEGGIRFNDELNGDNLQAAIDAALEEAQRMQTPWFAHEYVLDARFNPGDGHIVEDDGLWPVKEHLQGMARCAAEDSLYPEAHEWIVEGIA